MRIVISSSNYGGNGTGAEVRRLADSLSQAGHSVQALVSTSETAGIGMRPDLVIGQHAGISVGRSLANLTRAKFAMMIHPPEVLRDVPADLVILAHKHQKMTLAPTSIPVTCLEDGHDTVCEAVKMILRHHVQNNPDPPPVPVQRHAPQLPVTAKVQSPPAAPLPSAMKTAVAQPSPSKKKDFLSVIVYTHDDGSNLLPFVQSLLDQSHTNNEVIIVDDASTDETSATLAKLSHPRLLVFRMPWPKGVKSSVKLALAQSEGDLFLFFEAGSDPLDKSYFDSVAKEKPLPLDPETVSGVSVRRLYRREITS